VFVARQPSQSACGWSGLRRGSVTVSAVIRVIIQLVSRVLIRWRAGWATPLGSREVVDWWWVSNVHRHTNFLRSCYAPPHHTTTVLRPFFRDHPGEPVPEENFWTLWCKGRLTDADTLTIRLGATTQSGLNSAHLHHSPRPDALPAVQPTVSMHLKHGYLTHSLLVLMHNNNICLLFRHWQTAMTNIRSSSLLRRTAQ